MKKISFKKATTWIWSHKIISIIILVICAVGGYMWYQSANTASAEVQYVIQAAKNGSISQTVTGSGQVSAVNQIDVKSKVSGTVQKISVQVGQKVKAGDLIATIDPKDALIDLENARISYQKLVKPAEESEITSAKSALDKSYIDAFNSISGVFLDSPTIMTGLKDMLYSKTGFLSDQQAQILNPTAREYRNTAGTSYDRAAISLQKVTSQYRELSRNSSREQIEAALVSVYDLSKQIAAATKDTQSAINFVITSQPEYRASDASSAASSVTTWSNTANSNVSSLFSAQNSIVSSKDSLKNLTDGADELDIKSQQISLSQKEDNYRNYFIRAPFDGIIGKISANQYDEAGSATSIATVVGNMKKAVISLNEVDAARVKAGQTVTLTFDAIDNFVAKGSVTEVDLVGTVTQGVVTYNVKIGIETEDDRIRPGMSANATIITNQKDNVLVVPTSAVKTKGIMKYVEVIENPNTSTANSNRTATASRSMTVKSETLPVQKMVKVGDSDDTNIEITEGLSAGDTVVVRTINGSTSQTTTAPSLLSGMGGQRSSGAVRITR